jgi:HlyD family secretion protein
MKKKIIAWVVVIALIGGVVGLRVSAANKNKYKAVKTVTAEKADIKSYLSTTAAIKSKNSKDYYGPQAKVLKVNVKLGDKVKKGDVLVTFDVQDPNVQISQAQIAYDNAVSQKNDAVNTNNQNASKLSDQGVDSQISYYTNNLNVIKDKIASLEAEISASSNSNIINADKVQLYGAVSVQQPNTPNLVPGQGSLYSQRDSLLNTLNSLKNTKVSLQPASTEKMKQMDNAIANAKLNLDNVKNTAAKTQTNITADFDGVVTALNAVEGNTLAAAAGPAVTVQDINSLKAIAMLGKYDANKIALEEPATIKNGVKEYKGKVSFIAAAASKNVSATGGDNTLEVDIDITDNPDGLKIDFTQDVDILLGEKNAVLSVPAECVKADKTGKSYVYVVESNKAIQKTVTLGLQADTNVEILDGIKAGDKVISNPSAEIINGTLVKQGGK